MAKLNTLTHAVPPDGNCFFHSLAWNLNVGSLRENDDLIPRGRQVRDTLIRRDDWNAYLESLDPDIRAAAPKYVAAAHPRTFTCDFIISFLVWKYPISFYIYGVERQNWTAKHHDDNNNFEPAMCFVHFETHQHYQPVFIADLATDSPLHTIRAYRGLGIPLEETGPQPAVWCVQDIRKAFEINV